MTCPVPAAYRIPMLPIANFVRHGEHRQKLSHTCLFRCFTSCETRIIFCAPDRGLVSPRQPSKSLGIAQFPPWFVPAYSSSCQGLRLLISPS